jgi:tetratricopeptide (TPR) repeat protein
VQPYLPPGAPDEHKDGQELLPWYRLLTYSDPHHWRGYMIGSWWLVNQQATDPQALTEAARFIDEGVRNNPEVFQLALMQGRIALQRERWDEALPAFDRAVTLAQKLRPADGRETPPRWSQSDEEDFRTAVRYPPMILLRKRHDLDAAQAAVDRAQILLPHDGPLDHLKAEIAWQRRQAGAAH